MTPEAIAFVERLRARGHDFAIDGIDVVARPELPPEDLTFLRANAHAVAAVVRAPRPKVAPSESRVTLDVQEEVEREAAAEQESEDAMVRAQMRSSRTVFRTCDGAMVELHRLSAKDVERLQRNGSIKPDEVKQWLSSRRGKRGGMFIVSR